MPAREDFQYAIVRVVPRVERGECLNAGVVLFSRRHGFLAARTELDEAALAALSPDCDPDEVRPHLGRSSGSPPATRRRSDRRARAVRAVPLADRAGEHDRPGVGGAHRPDERPGGGARAPVRAPGRALAQVPGFRCRCSCGAGQARRRRPAGASAAPVILTSREAHARAHSGGRRSSRSGAGAAEDRATARPTRRRREAPSPRRRARGRRRRAARPGLRLQRDRHLRQPGLRDLTAG